MTVIVWDGTTLAADREAGDNWIKCNSVTKIARIAGHLVGCAGPASAAREMQAWFAGGADPATFHESLRKLDSLTMLAIAPDGTITVYQNTPYPVIYVPGQIGNRYAIGSGKEAAMAVMLAGHDARRAVEITSLVCAGCGNGVDTLELTDDTL
jgi:hypothetical protein